MRYLIKKVPYWGFIKISVFLNFILGFLFGIFYAVTFGLMMGLMSNVPGFNDQLGGVEPMAFGAMIIIMPIVCAFGFSFFNTFIGLILVFFYNILSRFIGGIELDLEPVHVESTQPAVQPTSPPPQQQPQQQIYSTPPPTYTETTSPPPPPAPDQNDNSDNKTDL